jgi:N-acylneuraminate cytidylyltransferase
MNTAIIPARGGSKRIPKKNIKKFCGKPMIAYSIKAAQASGLFDLVLVSTDDEEIACTALALGAEVPFLRPANLADDLTPMVPVVRHAATWVREHIGESENVCCILATAPFLNGAALTKGYNLLIKHPETEFVFSATDFAFPILRAVRLDENGKTRMFWPENELVRSQDLPEAFHDAGQFYWGNTDAWYKRDRIFSASSRIVKLPRHTVQDIDTPEDWEQAEILFEFLERNKCRLR